ncbi:MAG TPA: DUF512 domain-containing protein [Firmicutes bacterium]|nr:DUF512 domain-containing protein [Bacillota bacterium]
MKKVIGYLIENVRPDSPASEAGIKAGWKLLRMDGQEIGDILDYKILESDTCINLLLLDNRGKLRRKIISKTVNEPLGLEFNPPTMDRLHYCANKCLFCFIDQNPSGMRPSLYIKDDDYRLSFLYGNFITLNRLNEEDLERIIKLHLSPLYVSIHSTDPGLRQMLFGNKRAVRGIQNLKKLTRAGIHIHAQIVLCPGINTGPEMKKTIRDLYNIGSSILSIALVPVGLTEHRVGLSDLKLFTAAEAGALIDRVENLQNYFFSRRGTRLIYAADELYVLSGREVPPAEKYENYPQLENGVGLLRIFLDELQLVEETAGEKTCKINISLATGLAAETCVKKLAAVLESVNPNLKCRVFKINNRFFGQEVTVAGLLTGSDLIRGLEGREPGDLLIIPSTAVNEKTALFLDGLSLQDLEKKLGIPVFTAGGPLEVLALLDKIGDGDNTAEGGIRQ